MTIQSPAPQPNRLGIQLNLALYRLTHHWLQYAVVLIAIYVTLPFAAPILMRLGLTHPARLIYTLYSPMCHQFGFRSMFLFGEQTFYPRYNTASGLIPFERYVVNLPDFDPNRVLPFWGQVGDIYAFTPGFQGAAKEFLGNTQMGYKTALCARDVAIFGALLAGSLLYTLPTVRRRLRPCPIWLFGLLGLTPIAIDGLSQMLGYPPFNLWPPRETLPGFRILTGALLGLMSAWLAFPHMELSMRDTRRQLERKLSQAGLLTN